MEQPAGEQCCEERCNGDNDADIRSVGIDQRNILAEKVQGDAGKPCFGENEFLLAGQPTDEFRADAKKAMNPNRNRRNRISIGAKSVSRTLVET